MADYSRFIKSLDVPAGVAIPERLTYEDLVATVLSRDHLEDDVRGINSNLDLIRRTRGGGWPEQPVTAEFNFTDLVWHELEFRDGTSFSYVLRDAGGEYLGCLYLYPLGRRTPLSEELLDHDVDVSWWVVQDAYDRGYYAKAYRAAGHWLAKELPFDAPHFSNAEVPEG